MSNIQHQREIERKKYTILSSIGNYGDSFHGAAFVKNNKTFFSDEDIKTIIDVGTGRGQFVDYMTKKGISCTGVDFAIEPDVEFNQDNFIRAEAHNIPVPDKSYDCLTSFDMLEHALEQDVEKIFEEFYRITKKWFVFSICPQPSSVKKCLIDMNMSGQLHMTVRPWEWWIEKIEKYGEVVKSGGYIICQLK